MKYCLYSDGATSNNGFENAVGGWAYALIESGTVIRVNSGHVSNATNQMCELTAALEACRDVENLLGWGDSAVIHSDSAYLVNCWEKKWYLSWLTNGWKNSKKEPVANQHLWRELIPYFTNPAFSFVKVKGHSGDKFNELVDELAVAAKLKEEENNE